MTLSCVEAIDYLKRAWKSNNADIKTAPEVFLRDDAFTRKNNRCGAADHTMMECIEMKFYNSVLSNMFLDN